MGRKKQWVPLEIQTVARAWRTATRNHQKGADQPMADYRDDIFRIVQMLAPTEHEEGRFGDRGADAILKYFRDTIAKDVQSFNKALRLVNCD